MSCLILTLALVGQYSRYLPGNDLPFMAAQERFVKDAVHPTDLEQVLPVRSALILRALGSPVYDTRRLAWLDLVNLDRDDQVRTLLWGEMLKDQHVRFFCTDRLDDVYRCVDCRGDGICWACRGSGLDPFTKEQCMVGSSLNAMYHSVDRPHLCYTCMGTGNPVNRLRVGL